MAERIHVGSQLLGAGDLLGDPVDAVRAQPAAVAVVGGGDQRLAEVAAREHGDVLIEHAPKSYSRPARTSRSAAARVASVMWLSIPSSSSPPKGGGHHVPVSSLTRTTMALGSPRTGSGRRRRRSSAR